MRRRAENAALQLRLSNVIHPDTPDWLHKMLVSMLTQLRQETTRLLSSKQMQVLKRTEFVQGQMPPVVKVFISVREPDALVYFIKNEDNGHIKIGHSIDPEKRLLDLQVSNSARLSIISTRDGGEPMEKHLHQKFAHLKIRGEWFTPGDDLLAYIQEQASA